MPDQTKSLPGILSASETLSGTVRSIGDSPVGCHRPRLAGLWRLPPGAS